MGATLKATGFPALNHGEDDELLDGVTIVDRLWVSDQLQYGSGVSGELATPMHLAAEKGDIDTLTALLAGGANPDVFSSCGTPLHAAARAGHTSAINILLQAGAQIDALCPEGLTPVLSAAVTGNAEAVNLLIVRGADLELAFLPGTHINLLHVCVDSDLVSAVATILSYEQGRALALCPGTAFKPLHAAALNSQSENDTEIIDMLMPYSGVDMHKSRAELIEEAQKLAQGVSGPLDCADTDIFAGTGHDSFCTPTAKAVCADGLMLPSRIFSAPTSAPPRLSFTPTANLDCCPADCSPSSCFDSTPPTPPNDGSAGVVGAPLSMGGGSAMQWDLVDCLRPSLRVKTHVAGDASLSGMSAAGHQGGTSSQASSASAMMIRRMESSTPGCNSGGRTMRSYEEISWAVAADGQRSTSSLRPATDPFLSHV